MTTLLRLPKEYHPDFQNPRVKPVGSADIDWDNSLTDGLIGCFLIDYSRGKRLLNLVDGLDLNTTDSNLPEPKNGIRGRELDFNGDKIYRTQDYPKLKIDGDITLICGCSVTNKSAVRGMIGHGSDGESSATNILYFLNFQTSGRVRFFHESGSGTNNFADSDVVSTPNGGYGIFSASRLVEATSTISFYENGKSIGSSSGITNASGGGSGKLTIGSGNPGNDTQQFLGTMNFIWIFNKVKTAAEHKALAENPYQILKPKIPISYFTADGVAPTNSLLLANRSIANFQGIRQ